MSSLITTLAPNAGSQTKSRRLARGRGSGLGGTSGRGMNGQNSRTGKGKRYPTFEGGQTRLFMRTPKRRGFTSWNPDEYVVVNLDQIEKLAAEGITTVDYAVLYERRIIREKGKLLKILGRGTLTAKVSVSADAASAGAKAAIEKAGGKMTILTATEDAVAPTPAPKKEKAPKEEAPVAEMPTEEAPETPETPTPETPAE